MGRFLGGFWQALKQSFGRLLARSFWNVRVSVEKRKGDWTGEQIAAGEAPEPYAVHRHKDNLRVYGGSSCLWQCLIGNGTATAGQALTYFNNANGAIGVEDTTTASDPTMTDLQAVTNKVRRGMDATYPQHTDGVTVAAKSITIQSTFGAGVATWAWNAWGFFNSPTAATGRMLNRRVVSMGTKPAGESWTIRFVVDLD